jgi:hypothetical protein
MVDSSYIGQIPSDYSENEIKEKSLSKNIGRALKIVV